MIFFSYNPQSPRRLHKIPCASSPFPLPSQLPGSDESSASTKKAYTSAIEAHQNFNLTVKKRTEAGAGGETLLLQFRSADNSTLDSHMPRIAVPAQVGKEGAHEGGPVYYWATVRTAATAATGQSSVLPPPVGAAGTGAAVLAAKAVHGSTTSNAVTSASNVLDGRPSGHSSGAVYSATSNLKLFALVDDNAAAFGDVVLGPMLGYGSFGRVYRGVGSYNRDGLAAHLTESRR